MAPKRTGKAASARRAKDEPQPEEQISKSEWREIEATEAENGEADDVEVDQIPSISSPDVSDEQPPLPDEQPPLPNEQPPSPNEATPVPKEQPPFPEEAVPILHGAPPLPDEQPPDDGWEPVWDPSANAFYFHNRITRATQWENPRQPILSTPPGLATHDRSSDDVASHFGQTKKSRSGGYNPAIHGDYDPTADYALEDGDSDEGQGMVVANAEGLYEAAGAFNRFTGRWQAAEINPDNHNDENKSKRQMNAFFDVEAAANLHDGRSLKAERQNKKFSKKEIKAFKEKRRERKEEKRRAWLRD